MCPLAASLYRLAASITGGMPGVTATVAGVDTRPVGAATVCAALGIPETAPISSATNNRRQCNGPFTNAPEFRRVEKRLAHRASGLSLRDGALDRVDCLRHDGVDAHLTQLGAGAARIPAHAVAPANRIRRGLRKVAANQARIRGQRKRCIRESCMRADLIVAEAAFPKRFRERGRGGTIVLRERVHAGRRRGPLPIQPIGDRLFILLVVAVVAQENDVAKSVQLETPCGVFEHFLKNLIGNADGPGEAQVRRRRADAAFGHIGHDRCHQRVAQGQRDFFRQDPDPHVVLAKHDVGPALLGASDRNENRPPSGADLVAELGPRQLIEKHGLRSLGERLRRGQQQDRKQGPHKTDNHGRILWDCRAIRQARRAQRPTIRANEVNSDTFHAPRCLRPRATAITRIQPMRVFNFSAGPAVLPEEVLRKAAAEMLDWHGSGMSVMEMSHRGKEFISIADKAEADLRGLLAIPANYKVLFLQGGAIAENAIVPMNLLGNRSVADYVNTGEWSKKSIKEAGKYCTVNIAASAEDKQFSYVPVQETWRLSKDAAYVHVCTNETIGGVEYQWAPETGEVPLVADMSSHILSRVMDVAKYGVIYGGAQKNMGPAGLTLVIVRDDLLGRAMALTPSAFNWKEQAEADSMLNTPPTYAIYVAGLVFEWLQAQGGLTAMEKKK